MSLTETFRRKLYDLGFEINEELGRGAFGSVYVATQRKLDRRVAVKVINSLAARQPKDRKRFQREALLLAKVAHPGIPYVLTKGLVEDTPYFVMQYIEGQPLDRVIRETQRIDVPRAVAICRDVLSALSAAHDASVIHRDVKPDNILIGASRAYVIDFSLGFCQEYGPGLSRMTVDRGLGVPDYASPEQKQDAKTVDHRTDLYSVGVVLFEMLVGHPKIPKADFPSVLSQCPAGLVEVVAKACGMIPDDRYQTATEFLSALNSAAASDALKFDRRTGLLLAECIGQQKDQDTTPVSAISEGLRDALTDFDISMGIGSLRAAGLIDVQMEEDWNGNPYKTIWVNERGFVQAGKWDKQLTELAAALASARSAQGRDSYARAGSGYGYGGYGGGDDDIPF